MAGGDHDASVDIQIQAGKIKKRGDDSTNVYYMEPALDEAIGQGAEDGIGACAVVAADEDGVQPMAAKVGSQGGTEDADPGGGKLGGGEAADVVFAEDVGVKIEH